MKRVIVYAIISTLFLSCSHRVVRSGYKAQRDSNKDCEVVIQKNISIPDSIAKKVGEIKLGESGFSVACSEEHAIELLKREACSIEADLILITQEKRPDFWSSCYRCKAEYYKFFKQEFKESYDNNSDYESDKAKSRVKDDRNRNVIMAVTAVIVGFLSATLLF